MTLTEYRAALRHFRDFLADKRVALVTGLHRRARPLLLGRQVKVCDVMISGGVVASFHGVVVVEPGHGVRMFEPRDHEGAVNGLRASGSDA